MLCNMSSKCELLVFNVNDNYRDHMLLLIITVVCAMKLLRPRIAAYYYSGLCNTNDNYCDHMLLLIIIVVCAMKLLRPQWSVQ